MGTEVQWTESRLAAPFKWLMWLGGLALFVLLALVAVDVLARNAGVFYVIGVIELSAVALVAAAGFPIAWTFIEDRHLTVEIGTHRLSQAAKLRMEGLWLLLGSLVLFYLAAIGYVEGLDLSERGLSLGIIGISPLVTHTLSSIGLGAAGLATLFVGIGKVTLRYRPTR